jgi:tripartite-type tricarboxylate transporter receptor subunit TctC
MNNIRRSIVIAALSLVALGAQAQGYPSRVITLINPYSAGGPADLVARALAKGLSEELGQQVIVDNKPGGGGGIAAQYVLKSAPDGYTLLLANNASQVMAPVTTPIKYDAVKDFQYLGMAASVNNVLVIHPSVKARTLKELIALARANPGKINFASSGVGGSPHLAAELLMQQGKFKLTHVPYKGAAPAVTDLIAGQTDLGIFNMSAVLQYIKAGKLVALAYAAKTRSPLQPDVPTFEQAGLPDFEVRSWYAVAAPKGLPAPVAQRLAKAIAAVHTKPDFQHAVTAQGADVWPLTPEQATDFIAKDTKMTLDLIKTANIKFE